MGVRVSEKKGVIKYMDDSGESDTACDRNGQTENREKIHVEHYE